MGHLQVEASKKKCKKLGIPLIFLDESGFSLSPIRGTTWCEIGKPRVLRETFSRHSQTGLGFITMTPKRQLLNFPCGLLALTYRSKISILAFVL